MKKILIAILASLMLFSCTSKPILNSKGEKVDYSKIINTQENTVITYAAIWCPDCHEYLPEFERLAKDNPKIKFIVIYTDKNNKIRGFNNGLKDINNHVKENNYQIEYYYDNNNIIANNNNISVIPSQAIIKNGKISNYYSDELLKKQEDIDKVFGKQ